MIAKETELAGWQPLEEMIPKEILRSEVQAWARRIKVEPKQIHIRPMSRKWGSCSTAGRVTLDTGLLTQPADFRKQVIVHELEAESGTGPILLNWAAPPAFGRSSTGRERRKRDRSVTGNMGKQKSRLTSISDLSRFLQSGTAFPYCPAFWYRFPVPCPAFPYPSCQYRTCPAFPTRRQPVNRQRARPTYRQLRTATRFNLNLTAGHTGCISARSAREMKWSATSTAAYP